MRDYLVSRGLIVETFETATTWDNFEHFHSQVINTVNSQLEKHCGGKGLVWCRTTHAYTDGSSLYYTVVGHLAMPEKTTHPLERLYAWDELKCAVLDTIQLNGGTVTHHHAVGRDHLPHFTQEAGEVYLRTLAAIKSELDPQWVLNPGVLIPLRLRPDKQTQSVRNEASRIIRKKPISIHYTSATDINPPRNSTILSSRL